MQVSQNTIGVLKNFSSLNSIFINDGQTPGKIRTLTEDQSIVAIAEIEEMFPEFQVYDLDELLRAISLFQSPELSFTDSEIKISSGRSRLNYGFCSKALIKTVPPKGVKFPSVDVAFQLSKDTINQVLKAAGALGLGDVVIKPGSDTNKILVSAEASEKSDGNSNTFSIEVDQDVMNGVSDFRAVIPVNRFKFLPGTYQVSVSLVHKFARLQSQGDTLVPIEYYFGLGTNSTYTQ